MCIRHVGILTGVGIQTGILFFVITKFKTGLYRVTLKL